MVKSDESLNREVLHAFYGKYAAENGLLDFETLYARVAKNAVRRKHGTRAAAAAALTARSDVERGRIDSLARHGR